MKISVVIPAYKAEATIHRALASVLKQTLKPSEVIVVDDGSPVALSNVEEQYDGTVKLYRKKNGGAASARNYGIDHASGDFIAFLDADDYWEPEKLERQLAVHLKFPEVGFSFGNFWMQNSPVENNPKNPAKLSRAYPDSEPMHLAGSDAFQAAADSWTGTVMVARPFLGSERFSEQLRTAEDRDLWFRLIKKGACAYLDKPLAIYVVVPGSLSRVQQSLDYQDFLSVITANSAELGERATKAWKAKTYRAWAGVLLNEKKFHEAFGPALMRLKHEPFNIEGYYIVSVLAACSIKQFLRL
jgi:glycosyltransferase involved in cell wall biosynthesis